MMGVNDMLIRVCKGMSCSINGGGTGIAAAIEKELTRHGINPDAYEIVTAHCLGRCADGPCVRVNGNTYQQMHENDVPDFVMTEVLPLFK